MKKPSLALLSALLTINLTAQAQTIIFSNSFTGMTTGVPPTSPWTANANVAGGTQNVVLDTNNIFGEGTNNSILRMTDTSTAATSVRTTNISGSSNVVTLSFNLYEPSGFTGASWILSLNDSTGTSDSQMLALVSFADGTVNANGKTGAYSLNTPLRIDLVINNSASTITDYQGTSDLASRRYDLWVDGTRVVQGAFVTSGVMTNFESITAIYFRTYATPFSQEVSLDNVYLFDGAHVGLPVPEPTSAAMAMAGSIGLLFLKRRRGRK